MASIGKLGEECSRSTLIEGTDVYWYCHILSLINFKEARLMRLWTRGQPGCENGLSSRTCGGVGPAVHPVK